MSTHSPDTNYQPSPRQADVFAGYDTFQLHSLGIDISSLPENELNWYTDLRSCSRRISNMLGLHVPELDKKVMDLALTHRVGIKNEYQGVDWPVFLDPSNTCSIGDFGVQVQNTATYSRWNNAAEQLKTEEATWIYSAALTGNKSEIIENISQNQEALITVGAYVLSKQWATKRMMRGQMPETISEEELFQISVVFDALDVLPLDAMFAKLSGNMEVYRKSSASRQDISRLQTLINDVLVHTTCPKLFFDINKSINQQNLPPEIAAGVLELMPNSLLDEDIPARFYSWRFAASDMNEQYCDIYRSTDTAESTPKSIRSIVNKVFRKNDRLFDEFKQLLAHHSISYRNQFFDSSNQVLNSLERVIALDRLAYTPGTQTSEIAAFVSRFSKHLGTIQDYFRARIFISIEEIARRVKGKDYERILGYTDKNSNQQKRSKTRKQYALKNDDPEQAMAADLRNTSDELASKGCTNIFEAVKLNTEIIDPETSRPINFELQLIPLEFALASWAARDRYNTRKR